MPTLADAQSKRGCGKRHPGGVYVECGLDAGGIDISKFTPDPPIPFDMDRHRGQELRRRGSTWHLFDWVGAAHYPTAADIFEEVRATGASRRAAPTQKFQRLSEDSRLVLVHPRAVASTRTVEALIRLERKAGLPDHPSYRQRCMCYRESGGEDLSHFKARADEAPPCTRFWWMDAGWEESFDRGSPQIEREVPRSLANGKGRRRAPGEEPEPPERVGPIEVPYQKSEDGGLVCQGTRIVGDVEYRTFGGPREGLETGPMDLEFAPGIILSLPVTAISVMASPDGSHRSTYEDIAARSSQPVVEREL